MIGRYLILGLLFSSALAIATESPSSNIAVASDSDVVNDEGNLARHPDQRWRAEGVEALRAHRNDEAVTYFRRAARLRQQAVPSDAGGHVLGRQVVDQNRPNAYAWMDLAAERGYRDYLVARERYWADLSEAERAGTLKVGERLYDGSATPSPSRA